MKHFTVLAEPRVQGVPLHWHPKFLVYRLTLFQPLNVFLKLVEQIGKSSKLNSDHVFFPFSLDFWQKLVIGFKVCVGLGNY